MKIINDELLPQIFISLSHWKTTFIYKFVWTKRAFLNKKIKSIIFAMHTSHINVTAEGGKW